MNENRRTSRLAGIAALLLLLVAALLPAGPDRFSFAVIGDGGCGCPAQDSIAEQMQAWRATKPLDTVLMLGDNIYGEYTILGFFGIGKRGGDARLYPDRFDRPYKSLLDAGVEFHAALGNHDLEADDGAAMITDRNRFHIEGDHAYYTFSPPGHEDLIAFFALNSNTMVGGKSDPDQVRWLQSALAKSRARWKVAYAHHPLYAPTGGHRVDARYRKAIEDILVQGGVQLFLAGHHHYYARIKPQNGILHIISGGAGRALHSPSRTELTDRAIRTYHFLYLEADPHHLTFRAVSHTGTLLDQGAL